MRISTIRFMLLTVLLAVPAGCALGQTPVNSAKLTITQENADIRLALKSLFTSAGVNYSLSPSVQGTVSVSLHDVPFRTALESILRSGQSQTPLTYRVENGVYVISERVVAGDPLLRPEARIVKVALGFARASKVVDSLVRLPALMSSSGLVVQAQSSDNTVLVTGTDDQIREAKEAIRLMDIQPKEVMLRAETVLVMTDSSGKKHRFIMSAMGNVLGDASTRLKSTASGEPGKEGLVLKNGTSDVNIRCRVNGDNSIEIDASWEFDFAWTAPGKSAPLRLHNSATSSRAILSGQTMAVNGLILKSSRDQSSKTDAEVLLFLTPTIVPHPTAKQSGNP